MEPLAIVALFVGGMVLGAVLMFYFVQGLQQA